MYDRNGDGVVSHDELRQVMRSLGLNLSHRETNKLIADADVNGDGSVDYMEFIEMMLNKE